MQFEEKDSKNTINVIIGIDKFLNNLDGGEDKLMEILRNIETTENCSFIIIDNVNKIKNHEYDEWYKAYVLADNGIWIGNGVDDQYLIKINSIGRNLINRCGLSYGYIINQGEPTMIKLLGLKEKGDNDE